MTFEIRTQIRRNVQHKNSEPLEKFYRSVLLPHLQPPVYRSLHKLPCLRQDHRRHRRRRHLSVLLLLYILSAGFPEEWTRVMQFQLLAQWTKF